MKKTQKIKILGRICGK